MMTAAEVLYRAAARIADRYGAMPDTDRPLDADAVAYELARAVALEPDGTTVHARRCARDAALAFLLQVLGHDPDDTPPYVAVELLRAAVAPMRGTWAVAVLLHAAMLAAAAQLRLSTPARARHRADTLLGLTA